jgi:O-antigen ligase
MIEFIFFLIVIAGIFAVWRANCREQPSDIIYLLIAFLFLCNSGALGNLWIIRLRHFLFVPLLVWSLWQFKILKRCDNGLVIWFCSLYLCILLGVFWSEGGWPGFFLKLKDISFLWVNLFVGLYFTTFEKVIKLLKVLALPLALSALFFTINRGITSEDGRLIVFDLNPNSIGLMMCVSCTILFAVLLCCRRNLVFLIIAFPGLMCALFAIFSSGSRTSIGSCFAGLSLLIISQLRNFKNIAMMIVAGSLMLFFFLFRIWGKLDTSLRTRAFDFSNMSGREVNWAQMLFDFKEAPFYGYGMICDYDEFGNIRWGQALNIYLNVYFELGLLGVVVGGGLLFAILWNLYQLMKKESHSSKWIVVALVVVPLVSGIAEGSAMRAKYTISVLFMLSIGILANAKRNPQFFLSSNHKRKNKDIFNKGIFGSEF